MDQSTELAEWVQEFALPSFVMTHTSVRWCPLWSSHPEAALVLDGLRRSHDQARFADWGEVNGRATASYLIETFYPLMRRITSEGGPFARCTLLGCGGVLTLEAGLSSQREN